jgi:hypothetical protein
MSLVSVRSPKQALPLSSARLNALRGGYLFVGVGLALVKWPLLPDARSLPLYEGVTLCMLTAMSLLALVGVRYPVRMLPILLFESAWKVLWLSMVALPQAVQGDLDGATRDVAVTSALVVVVLAVIPWRHVWRTFVEEAGDPWRSAS